MCGFHGFFHRETNQVFEDAMDWKGKSPGKHWFYLQIEVSGRLQLKNHWGNFPGGYALQKKPCRSSRGWTYIIETTQWQKSMFFFLLGGFNDGVLSLGNHHQLQNSQANHSFGRILPCKNPCSGRSRQWTLSRGSRSGLWSYEMGIDRCVMG